MASNFYMAALMKRSTEENSYSDDEEAQRSSSEVDSRHGANDDEGLMHFPMMSCMHQRALANEESSNENESYDDEEEARRSLAMLAPTQCAAEEQMCHSVIASMAHMQAEVKSLQNNNEESNVSSDSWHNDDDEESQISQPPQVVEINLPRINAHANDVATINSILGSIGDPAIKAVLESLIEDPENAHQHTGYDEYTNQPDPSQHSWTPIDVLYDGLLYAGFDMKRLNKNNLKRKAAWFKTFYGVEHTTVSPYLVDLRKEYPDINYRDCFMTLNWLTLYEVYPVLSARWKRREEYIGSKIIECGMKMANFAREKIIYFELKHDVQMGRTVDCVTFEIYEMRQDPNSKWFDWKTHSAGLVSYCYLVW